MTLRSVLTATAVSSGLVVASIAAAPVAASADTLPSVDMARVAAAAQVEPRCGQTASLSDDTSTARVQSALTAKGLSTTADGWYGNGTTSSYASWQRRLGYSGIDANGLPGTTSLTSLGKSRFTVNHPVTVAAEVTPTAASASTPGPSRCSRPRTTFSRAGTSASPRGATTPEG